MVCNKVTRITQMARAWHRGVYIAFLLSTIEMQYNTLAGYSAQVEENYCKRSVVVMPHLALAGVDIVVTYAPAAASKWPPRGWVIVVTAGAF